MKKMKLENAIVGMKIPIPIGFIKTVKFYATCELTTAELDAIYRAFSAFQEEIAENPPPMISPLPVINVIITDRDQLLLRMDDNQETLGLHIRLVLLQVSRWRKRNMQADRMLQTILEELCHAIYLVDDELLVEEYVLRCYRHIDPNAQLANLYNPDWEP